MEHKWITWGKRLHALASTGMHYGKDRYDRERYREIADIAKAMLAEIGNLPIERVCGLVSSSAKGHATPKVDVRGALIVDDKILMVQEKNDGLWTLPGGFADVGLSASENIKKEFMEEAGVEVRATRLYCVRHKAKNPYDPDIRDFYKLFFICEKLNDAPPTAGQEIKNVLYFEKHKLPPLSRGRVIEQDILLAFAANSSPQQLTVFD